MSGAGIGNPDNATCLLNKMMEESGSDKKAEVTEVDGQEGNEEADALATKATRIESSSPIKERSR